MPKQLPGKTPKPTENIPNGNVYVGKNGCIVLKILAKPGAKHNKVTDLTDDGIGIQINAPPVDGEANAELLKYLSSVLSVRKSDISLDRGFKSRCKFVTLCSDTSTVEEVKKKLELAMRQ